MHQTRAQTTKKLPIPRKGTQYVARPLSHTSSSVSVVSATRDILGIAKTSKEVKEMIKQNLLKINGRDVKDERESIKLFNIFHADKSYFLKINKAGRFFLEETKKGDEKICKVLKKTVLKKGKIQINLHDGTNVLSDKSINTGDTLYIDFSGKIKKHVPLEKGSHCFIYSGRYIGQEGKIDSIGEKLVVSLEDKKIALERSSIILI